MATESDHPADPSPSTSPPPLTTSGPFRFKSKPSRSSSHRDRSASPSSADHRRYDRRRHHHNHRHHHRHHHRRRRSYTPPDDLKSDDDTAPKSSEFTDPDAAFRESLFDALADDEGAAYWEGVYGQAIHTYSPYFNPDSADEDADGNPKLERMTDEQYMTYVRSKMWEKSHGHIVEERRRRDEEQRKRKEEEKRVKEKGRRWRDGLEEALKRGEERRRSRRWVGVWERYNRGWEELRLDAEVGAEGKSLKTRIAWPVESGSRTDVGKEGVETFYRNAPKAAGLLLDLSDVLKKERVRWHPDKMQQRAGSGGLDAETMKIVTAVFQVVDRLWSEMKGGR